MNKVLLRLSQKPYLKNQNSEQAELQAFNSFNTGKTEQLFQKKSHEL